MHQSTARSVSAAIVDSFASRLATFDGVPECAYPAIDRALSEFFAWVEGDDDEVDPADHPRASWELPAYRPGPGASREGRG